MTLTALVWVSTICQVIVVIIFSGFFYLAWKAYQALNKEE